MSDRPKHNQPRHPDLSHFKLNQNTSGTSNNTISPLPTDRFMTLVSGMTACCLPANRSDQSATNPRHRRRHQRQHADAHTFKVQSSIKPQASYQKLLGRCKPRGMHEVSDGSSDNDEVDIIECLVFINATAETRREEGGEEGGGQGRAGE